jgi:hypothetical protein
MSATNAALAPTTNPRWRPARPAERPNGRRAQPARAAGRSRCLREGKRAQRAPAV